MSRQVDTEARKPSAMQRTDSLSVRLREGTRHAHRVVERVRFIRCFLKGVLHRPSYLRYLCDLHLLYQTLEQELSALILDPVVGPVCLPTLFRQKALASDLAHLYGAAWQQALIPSLVAQEYAQHLRRLSHESPHRLVAHAYTRYLGDLAGGQILRAFAKLALGLSQGEGLSFYDFPLITDVAVMREQFRRILDALPLSVQQSAEVVTEAVRAFQMNQAILEGVEEELDADVRLGNTHREAQHDQEKVTSDCGTTRGDEDRVSDRGRQAQVDSVDNALQVEHLHVVS